MIDKILIAMTAVMLSTTVFAGGYGSGYGHHGKQQGYYQQKMMERLDLTEDQNEELAELMSKHKEEHKALKQEMHEKMKSLKEQYHTQMKTLIGEDKFNQLHSMRKHHKPYHGKRGHACMNQGGMKGYRHPPRMMPPRPPMGYGPGPRWN